MLLGVYFRNVFLLQDFRFGLQLPTVEAEEQEAGASETGVSCFCALQPLTALIGSNSSGKSSFFKAMEFWADCQRVGVAEASQRNGQEGFFRIRTKQAKDPIYLSFLYYSHHTQSLYQYAMSLQADTQGKPYVLDECLQQAAVSHAWMQQVIEEDPVSVSQYLEQSPLEWTTRLSVVQGKGYLQEGQEKQSISLESVDHPALSIYGRLGANTHCVHLLQYMTHWYFLSWDAVHHAQTVSGSAKDEQKWLLKNGSSGYRHLDRTLSNCINVLSYMERSDESRYRAFLHKMQSKVTLNAPLRNALFHSDFSRADTRLFALYLLLADYHPRPLVMLDLPEQGLHPDRISELVVALRDYSLDPSLQLLYTTHHPTFLDAMHPKEVWNFTRGKGESSYEDSPFLHVGETWGDDGNPELMPHVSCVGSSPLILSLYEEGVELGSLWYSGYFDDL